ncbi:MAG: YicC/YloC family endoribonuclease [Pseudomonadota bacterium]
MTLQSMTGYANLEGNSGSMQWAWEMRSVNGKGFDVRIRLPAGFELIEPDVRKAVSQNIARGNLQVNLTVTRDRKTIQATVNQDVLDAVIIAADRLLESTDAEPPRIDGLLNIRGVLEFSESKPDDETLSQERQSIMDGLDATIAAMTAMRKTEGEKIGAFLGDQVAGIEELVRKVAADPSTEPDRIAERLSSQVRMLLDSAAEFDEDRVYVEAAILASKADIREEIDRLSVHVEACRQLLADGGPIGRRLDFLAQELNRESNTICSKSNASSVTAIGLELKVLIEQFREQVQNLE